MTAWVERPGAVALEDEVILHGVAVAEVNFLPKPFTLDGLADAVERVLKETRGTDAVSTDERQSV